MVSSGAELIDCALGASCRKGVTVAGFSSDSLASANCTSGGRRLVAVGPVVDEEVGECGKEISEGIGTSSDDSGC